MDATNEKLVPLCVTENAVHEMQLIGALKDENIECVVRSFFDSAYDGLFEKQHGHSMILVFDGDLARAKEIVCNIPLPENIIPPPEEE
ncbi:MAG: hypothetical protein AB1656_02955 [Candidatus Omnitrophota bacterium]